MAPPRHTFEDRLTELLRFSFNRRRLAALPPELAPVVQAYERNVSRIGDTIFFSLKTASFARQEITWWAEACIEEGAPLSFFFGEGDALGERITAAYKRRAENPPLGLRRDFDI